MNYERISQLYALLNGEFKKDIIDNKRIAEINYYLSQEFSSKPDVVTPTTSWFDKIVIPPNWKTYVTMTIGAFVAMNTQIHLVPQNVQEGLLAGAVALGFWAVNGTQTSQLEVIKSNIHSFGQRMTSSRPDLK